MGVLMQGATDLSALNFGFLAPVTRGLRLFHLFGNTLAISEKNLSIASDKVADSAAIGALPIVGSTLTLGNGKYIQTAVPTALNRTIFFEMMFDAPPVDDAHSIIILGDAVASDGMNVNFTHTDAGALAFSTFYTPAAGGAATGATSAVVPCAAGVHGLYCATIIDGVSVQLENLSLGTEGAVTAMLGHAVPGAGPNMQIGACPIYTSVGFGGGTCHMSTVSEHDVVLTSDEKATYVSRMRKILASGPNPITV